jgi:hypothetical protein
MEIIDSVYTSLRAIGKDENWVHDWIIEKPSRLGLGDIEIKRHELIRCRNLGGRLDIFAYRTDIDTFYEIEIMLDECDANHGLRALDFWSRERLKHPDSRHVAVLVSEDLSSRYKPILEGLPQVLPFIGIEIKVLKLPFEDGVATILTSIIVQSHDLKDDQKNGNTRFQAWGQPCMDTLTMT